MCIIAGFLFISLMLSAPFAVLAEDSTQLKKKILMDQKKLVLMENIEFTDKENSAFWPVYEKYQEKLFRVGQRSGKLIIDYVSAYETFSDEQAKKFIDEYFDIQEERHDVMKKYAKELSKVLPVKKVFRYLQIENKLDAIAGYELVEAIPLGQ